MGVDTWLRGKMLTAVGLASVCVCLCVCVSVCVCGGERDRNTWR